MPGQPPPLTDEKALLLAYVGPARDGLRNAAFGLTDEQARLTPTAGTLSIGGLVKHEANTERHWIDIALQRQSSPGNHEDYLDGFRLREDETLAVVLSAYDEVARDAEAAIAGAALDQPVPMPRGAPWFPADVDAWWRGGCCSTSSRRPPATPATPRAGVDRRGHDVRADGRRRGLAGDRVAHALVADLEHRHSYCRP